MYYYFTKDIFLLTGPMWFNDAGYNGSWKWTVQLDINTPQLFGKKKWKSLPSSWKYKECEMKVEDAKEPLQKVPSPAQPTRRL